jgi:hypothetical protein
MSGSCLFDCPDRERCSAAIFFLNKKNNVYARDFQSTKPYKKYMDAMPLHTFVDVKEKDIFLCNPLLPFDSNITPILLPKGVRRLLVFPSKMPALLNFGPSVGAVFVFEVENFIDNNRYLAWVNTSFEVIERDNIRQRKLQCVKDIGFSIIDALTEFNEKNQTNHIFYIQVPCFPKELSIRTQIGDAKFVETLLNGMDEARRRSSPYVELGLQDPKS